MLHRPAMSGDRTFRETLELIEQARAGDRDALHDLLVRYRERLLGRIRLMMGAEARRYADSQDFLQGAFVEVIAAFDRAELTSEPSLLRWMTSIARNNIRDSLRRRREQALEAFSASLDDRDGRASPVSEAALRERVDRLIELLERLDEREREVIELRDFEGLDYRAVGARLGLGASGARMLHTRALIRIGQMIGPRDG
jgi:RNA polymerase sigma-70 factor, ECF subfamily